MSEKRPRYLYVVGRLQGVGYYTSRYVYRASSIAAAFDSIGCDAQLLRTTVERHEQALLGASCATDQRVNLDTATAPSKLFIFLGQQAFEKVPWLGPLNARKHFVLVVGERVYACLDMCTHRRKLRELKAQRQDPRELVIVPSLDEHASQTLAEALPHQGVRANCIVYYC